jgi:hypothetical protein
MTLICMASYDKTGPHVYPPVASLSPLSRPQGSGALAAGQAQAAIGAGSLLPSGACSMVNIISMWCPAAHFW